MKYGKRLRAEIEKNFPEWKGQFMSYKELKQQLNLIHPRFRAKRAHNWRRAGGLARRRRGFLLCVNYSRDSTRFTRLLDNELDKVIGFYFDKEEDYVIRLKELKVKAANLVGREEMLQVQRDVLSFHADMVLLLRYSVLNFTGLIKIVKKHNKKTGRSFEFSSMARVMQQPNFSTDMLHQLMKECEDILDRLFL